MSRRTVDITVDAYDAPMLAALAKRRGHQRGHQRALGRAEDGPRMRFALHAWSIFRLGPHGHFEANAARIKRIRTSQERERPRPRAAAHAALYACAPRCTNQGSSG